jgi:hypothetical protein
VELALKTLTDKIKRRSEEPSVTIFFLILLEKKFCKRFFDFLAKMQIMGGNKNRTKLEPHDDVSLLSLSSNVSNAP